eukprot:SAG31_NODE_5355_length_2591_cov_2.022472_3_plen_59_part_00
MPAVCRYSRVVSTLRASGMENTCKQYVVAQTEFWGVRIAPVTVAVHGEKRSLSLGAER